MMHTIYLTADGSDGNDGTRARPLATLAQAVALAGALPRGDRRRIVVGDGVYHDTEAILDAGNSGLEEPSFTGVATLDRNALIAATGISGGISMTGCLL
jgi:hypothetical protein